MDELLSSVSSAELSEWMAEFRLRDEESTPGTRPREHRRASGDEAFEVLRKAARR